METLKRWTARFQLEARGTTVGTEFRGAVATFLTMAYILFVNPAILANAGVPRDGAVACTAAAAGICSILMGLFSNLPVALASGMGLNAVVAFQVAPAAGGWQAAMGLVVLNGIAILLLVLAGVREAVMDAIPVDLRRAIGAGIGLFIAFIGLVNARLVVPGVDGGPPVTWGKLVTREAVVASIGLAVSAFLIARRVKGALLWGVLVGTTASLACGLTRFPASLDPPSFAPAFQADVPAAFRASLVPLLFSLLMVDFFDTLGTATAVAGQAGLIRDGKIPGIRGLLVVDSLSAALGGLFGVSSVTSYIESSAGVAEGARTGLHSVFVGLFFLLAIFIAPLAAVVPAAATAPALVLVGFLMIAQLKEVDFDHLETAIPAFVTLIAIPFTYSISHGIGYGFILYAVIKLLAGKAREVHPVLWLAAGAFASYFVWG